MADEQLDIADTTWTLLTDDLPTTGGGSVAFGRNANISTSAWAIRRSDSRRRRDGEVEERRCELVSV